MSKRDNSLLADSFIHKETCFRSEIKIYDDLTHRCQIGNTKDKLTYSNKLTIIDQKLLPNKMTINFYMFNCLMEYKIVRNVDSCLVVIVHA